MRYEESSSKESHKRCKKPKPLVVISDETAPDSLVNSTDLTPLTLGAVRKFYTQVIINLRDTSNNIRGSSEQVRCTSVYPTQTDKIFNLTTGEFTLIVKGKQEKYSLLANADAPFPIPQVPTSLGVFKLTSIQGKATYSRVQITYQGIGLALRVTYTFF